MRRTAVIFIALWVSAQAAAKPVVPAPGYRHDRFQTEPRDMVREFRAYITSFDGPDDDDGDGKGDLRRIPEWVSYEIRAAGKDIPSYKRPSRWFTEREFFEKGIAPSDESYHFSREFRETHPDHPLLGYDRGHLCMKHIAARLGPDADWNTHTMLNAVPQRHNCNAGIWLHLEKKTAAWADRYGRVWVICGPVFYENRVSAWLGQPGELPVAIPDALFKIVVREGKEGLQVLALLYPQDTVRLRGGYDHRPYLVPVDRLEALTGLDFFTVLPEAVERRIESQAALDIWD